MAELTKEWLLRTIAELEEERDSMPGVVNVDAAMALAAMKLALASLEAKDKIPELRQVIYHFRDWNEGFPVERFKADYVISWMLVNYPPAQPAPVSVPDERAVELLATDLMKRIDKITGERHSVVTLSSLRVSIVEACRAAMLQGVENAETPTTMQTAPALDSSPKIAESPTGINQGKSEPVTTANKLPFEQWLSQQTGTIDVECGCVMTEVFFHWLRVAYEAGNYPVIPDGWVLVPIEPTYQMCEAMGLQWESPRFPDRYKAMLAAVKK
ncbi:hypothetical protein AB9P79_004505 [Enterobacter hormaechei]|uniref:hypothetical protein n=1 Tax=Enterobacter hormaechei TaxID=158836 RepID=UPI001C9348F7|nr:hypothetical protein [Enterobacter hormaechei]MBY4619647.1 hypothetical protein [Enterobacter hormaechei]MBY7149072.1 hypothetical protein [Enterobacter hormaechei]HBM7580784.1 hypothetical protein [Enterobacter hormaechei subsp. xiangfangensis]